jgi:DNA-binding LytR/AlgR family response regulator
MKKIVVIENDVKVLTQALKCLQNGGYKTFSAELGVQGITLVKEVLPDLIICAYKLPDIDGIDVVSGIIEENSIPIIPVIMLIERNDFKNFRQIMNNGADDCLVKPLDDYDLLKSVEMRIKKYEWIKENYLRKNSESESKKLTYESSVILQVANKPKFVNVSDILAIESEKECTRIFLKNSDAVPVRKLMKEWENILPPREFKRIHRSYMININCIEKIENWYKRSFMVKIKGVDKHFIISERYASKLMNELSI